MTTDQWAKKIWSALEELQVVDTDGLDPRMENAIKKIEEILYEIEDEITENDRYRIDE